MKPPLLWIECYKCGCSAEALTKRALTGYCSTHGENRIALYPPVDADTMSDVDEQLLHGLLENLGENHEHHDADRSRPRG